MKRGVAIERVFVYHEWTNALKALVEDQVAHGVKAYVVSRSIVPAELVVDMAVWDHAFTYQFELNSDGEPINNLYSVNDVDIARRVDQVEVLKSLGREFDKQAGAIVDPHPIT
jgi:hypothetical protein